MTCAIARVIRAAVNFHVARKVLYTGRTMVTRVCWILFLTLWILTMSGPVHGRPPAGNKARHVGGKAAAVKPAGPGGKAASRRSGAGKRGSSLKHTGVPREAHGHAGKRPATPIKGQSRAVAADKHGSRNSSPDSKRPSKPRAPSGPAKGNGPLPPRGDAIDRKPSATDYGI
jgi:hypothetical protein